MVASFKRHREKERARGREKKEGNKTFTRRPLSVCWAIGKCKTRPFIIVINLNVCHENDSEGYVHANF